jgi:hypothetical protein
MKENDRENFDLNALLFHSIPLTVHTVPMIVKSTIAWILEEEQNI